MKNISFRDLKADEIDVRVGQIFEDLGITLLLYKDARVDQDILDETVGNMNWQRHHSRDNANCIVSIYDEDKKEWVEKEDTGTESNTEKEKGIASDSFKRACVNWGIGRELYTSPFIWVKKEDVEIYTNKKGKLTVRDSFYVEKIIVKNKKIVLLSIRSINKGKSKRVFTYSEQELKDD